MRPCWCLTGQHGSPPPPLRGRPHRLTAGRGAAVPSPARTVSGSVSNCRGPVRGEKSNFLQMHAKMYHFYSTEGHETPASSPDFVHTWLCDVGQSMEWTGSIRWIHNPVQSMRIWIGLDQKFTNSADSGLDWIQKCTMCITYLET